MGPQATNKTKQTNQPQRASTPQKTAEAPSPDRRILQLQHKLGNQGVLRLLEAGRLQRHRPGDTNRRAEGRGAEGGRLPEAQQFPPAGVLQRQAALEEDEEGQSKAEPPVPQRQKRGDEEEPAQRMEEEEERPLTQRMTEDEEEPMQGQFIAGPAPAQGGVAANATGMPGGLKAGLEGLSGKDLSGVRVHRNSSKPAQVNALAYTQGQDIHVAPGQEKHLAHEGWHAVQQMQGRVTPTMQAKGVSINDDEALEREADVMGAKALQMTRVGHSPSGSIQPVPMKANNLGVSTTSTIQRKQSDLDRLNEILSYWNVPEGEIISLCGKLTAAEKKTVLASGYKKRMASALNISEMVRAVNNLGPSLKTKLEWVDATVYFMRSIDYVNIAGMVKAAPQGERDALKTDTWKDFFVKVCTNKTMDEALIDLNFDMETQVKWMIAESDRATVLASIDFMARVREAPFDPKVLELLGLKVALSVSARFGGDTDLEKVFAGTKTLKSGDTGIPVVKIQQALVDMGYTLRTVNQLTSVFSRFRVFASGQFIQHTVLSVTNTFDAATVAAVKKFQTNNSIPDSGEVDKVTLDKMKAIFHSRKPYIDQAKFDPIAPGTRTLTAAEKTAVKAAMVPKRGVGGAPPEFDPVGYGAKIKTRLSSEITSLHTRLFASKQPLRADPTKMHAWSVLEQTTKAAKEVTDDLYGSYIPGGGGPAITAASGTLVDQWTDEVARNAALTPALKKSKAKRKVWYLISSNCRDINRTHSAVPSDPTENALLIPIVNDFIDTAAKVRTLLELDIGWTGAQLGGTIYLQRFKETTKVKNRKLLWKLFHTSIHEYLHALTHTGFKTYAQLFRVAGDAIRYNTLIEGFNEFFTENVRASFSVTTPLRKKVEGPYYDAAVSAPKIKPGLYGSRKQAEQVVSIVGIRNAQSAYFKGEVDKIGGP